MEENYTYYEYDISEELSNDPKYRKYFHPEPEPHHFYIDRFYKITTTCEHLNHILFYNHNQRNELLGLNARLLFEKDNELKKAYRRLVNIGDTYTKEIKLKRKDNSIFWVLMFFRLEKHILLSEKQILCQFININEFKSEEAEQKDSIPTKINKVDYINTIGIVTALPRELAAMETVLDVNSGTEEKNKDPNDYTIGYIKNKNGKYIRVVIAVMKEMGTNNASTTCTNMLRSFDDIDDVIMVGIAGGIPDINKSYNHVRLGDVVVSDKKGLLQYDNIKKTESKIQIRDASDKPSAYLLGKVNKLISEFDKDNHPWNNYLDEYIEKWPKAKRPSSTDDILRIKGKQVEHPIDEDRISNYPKIHHGPIGSSNTLLKDEVLRNQLRDNHGVKAIEMEGSGIADGTWTLNKGYLIVRGIVDYCNSDKTKKWQYHGALCAACYTKCIIESILK